MVSRFSALELLNKQRLLLPISDSQILIQNLCIAF